mmetsp:Transcript_11794/g.26847  ORF Transcript_11794/g.26847 Transcript_11794/m.26847 type:complete len:257 (-) Transcript_11794:291-1061(-)
MGLCCGIPRKKHYDFQDYHETFVFGQVAVHRVIHRSLQQVVKHSSSLAPEREADFWRYVRLTRQFLEVHHKQEDEVIFARSEERAKATLFAEESKEHQALVETLARIEELEHKGGVDSLAEMGTIAQKLVEIMEGDAGHLNREEKILTGEFFREHFAEKEVKQMSKDIHDMISREGMDRGVSLVFMIYHLTDEEKVFFDERMPCIMRRFIFPRFAKRESTHVWGFASNPRWSGGVAVWQSNKTAAVNPEPEKEKGA